METVVTKKLDALHIAYRLLPHRDEVYSAKEAAKQRGIHLNQITKCMLCYDKKKNLIAFLVPGSGTLDFKKARKAIQSNKMSWVKPEILQENYGLTIGAISPVQLIGKARFVIDQILFEQEEIAISSGQPGSGVMLLSKDLIQICEAEVFMIV